MKMSTHKHRHRHADMLSVEEAYERIMTYFAPLDVEPKPILEALGQVLAVDIRAEFDIPLVTNSAMDGYAVRHMDTNGVSTQSPKLLKVLGIVAAGMVPTQEVTLGTALRIMTGAPVPYGADCVVPFEETDEIDRKRQALSLDHIGICYEQSKGNHIRPAGEDIRQGSLALEKGCTIRQAEIGVLASLGLNEVHVIRRPVVAILATGDELIHVGEQIANGKTYDSNSFGLAAAVQSCGGVPRILGIAKDNLNDLNEKLEQGLSADLLLTSAGVSRGDYDIVKDALMERGEIGFWSVRMRPAKPLAFGVIKGPNGMAVPHLGLPGNPVSAMVAFEEFGRPAILHMLGKRKLRRPVIEAVLEGSIHNDDGRRVFARVQVNKRGDTYYATPTGPQGSNVLSSMSKANGLALCPEEVPVMKENDRVIVKMLDWNEEVDI